MPRALATTPSLLLVRAAHPRQALVTAAALGTAAAVAGRPLREVGLVAATVLVGQSLLGWADDLTDREREVLALIGEGLNNEEIAARLVVSPATARTHVSRAMIKLGARDRAQLVVIAYQSGLVR